ncbi:MAG: cation:proton antiporter [Candidatus Nanohaloarchaea archaeon]|nr:cation:proton antiporter [Candidatus Nanohaloarchaea archaeon]
MVALGFEFVLALALVYGTTYLFGFLERYDIPVLAVEILAGIVFGSFLGVVGPSMKGYGLLVGLAAFGLLMIMFDAGLELDPQIIRDNPVTIAKLSLMTFFLPFLSGLGLAVWLGLGLFAGFLVGITVSTTSLGLVYPLLEDFGLLETERGQVILSTTVMNDLLSMVALAYGIAIISPSGTVTGVALVSGVLLIFLLIIPVFLVDPLSNLLRDRVFNSSVKVGVVLTMLFALVFEHIGIHAILGAFFAGFLIAEVTHEGHEIEEKMKPVINLTAPVFFFYVGMSLTFSGLWRMGYMVLIGVITIGLLSKVVGSILGGFIVGLERRTSLLLASAMPGRLSISVAAAEIGLVQGVISQGLYESFILLSVLSVFLSSLAFRVLASE